MKFTRSKDSAEEVVQDVFVNLWEKRFTLVVNSSLRAYLFTAVRNQSLNYLKHLQVINEYNSYYSDMLNDAGYYYSLSQETGASLLMASELEKKIEEAVDSLPKECRRIFLLSRHDGLKNQEIADELGISVNTVQKQMSIALGRLKIALKNYLPSFLFCI